MDPFNPAAFDPNDPAAVSRECADLAAGMEQQAQAATTHTALAGHPSPAHLFMRASAALAAASALLKPAMAFAPAAAADPPPAAPPKPSGRPK